MCFKKYVLALALISFSSVMTVSGESMKDIHQKAHSHQLANAKSALDKTVIQDFIKSEILVRENAEEISNTLSGETAILVSDLLTEARSHLGKRYRSGGKGPSAFDCSGFSSYVFRQFGYSLGASSRDQFKQGDEIKINKLRAGDLVFFTGRNSKGGVGHVGIVTEADNEKGTFKFIHAATSGGIRIDSNKGYYEGRYLGARRIIKE